MDTDVIRLQAAHMAEYRAALIVSWEAFVATSQFNFILFHFVDEYMTIMMLKSS
jgi:hypothetical protein